MDIASRLQYVDLRASIAGRTIHVISLVMVDSLCPHVLDTFAANRVVDAVPSRKRLFVTTNNAHTRKCVDFE